MRRFDLWPAAATPSAAGLSGEDSENHPVRGVPRRKGARAGHPRRKTAGAIDSVTVTYRARGS